MEDNNTEIKSIKDLLGTNFLSEVKIVNPQLLFEPYWKNLKINRCPLCGNKLKFPYKKTVSICNGKKHKPFVIKLDRLQRIKEIDYSKKILPYKNM